MKLAVQHYRFETLAAAYNQNNQPVSIFIWRDRRLDQAARLGDIVPGIVRSVDKGRAEAFVELSNAEMGFFNLAPKRTPPTEGERLNVLVRAEAWKEKFALVRPVDQPAFEETEIDAFSAWREQLGLTSDPDWTDRDAEDLINAAFDEAVASSVTLPEGGQIHFDSARALTAVDVDTSGRKPGFSGRDVNTDAIETLARQISLRRLAGLLVVDLCGNVRRDLGDNLRKTLNARLHGYGLRKAEILLPSGLGLMEMALPRSRRPISEYDPDTCSDLRQPVSSMFRFLRELEFGLRSDRVGQFEVNLSARLKNFAKLSGIDWQSELAERYGHRLRLGESMLNDLEFEIRSV